jgi:2'-5' RNA ligase superfamily
MVAVVSERESALLLPVPAAEDAVGGLRAALDLSARDGVPAHVTVLYPFLTASLIDDPTLHVLGRLFASVGRFGFTLDRVGWFGESVVWLGPRDERPFRALTELAFEAFPACPPYRGQYADVVPHLTVGHAGDHVDGDPLPALRAAEDAVRPHLPITVEATEVILMIGPSPERREGAPGTWRTRARFPLR